jgi:hypothetical protein
MKLSTDSDMNDWTNRQLFDYSVYLSINEHLQKQKIQEIWSDIRQQIDQILYLKKAYRKLLTNFDKNNILAESFDIDGSIKVSNSDLLEVLNFFDWDKNKVEEHINNLIDFFWYHNGKEFKFRNEYYYHLHDGIEVDWLENHKSINSVKVVDIDLEKFIKTVDNHFVYTEFMLTKYQYKLEDKVIDSILSNMAEFKLFFASICNDSKINQMYEKVLILNDKYTWDIWLNTVDQNELALEVFQNLYKKIEIFINRPTKETCLDILFIYNNNTSALFYIEHTFGISFDSIFRKFIPNIEWWANKVILWLLDSKINTLASIQNLTQILLNDNILNPNFEWNLLFNQSMVREIIKLCPQEVIEFWKKQELVNSSESKIELYNQLSQFISYYVDILLWDKPESLLKINERLLLDKKNWNTQTVLFQWIFNLLWEFLSILEKYWKKIEEKNELKKAKFLKKKNQGNSNWINENTNHIRAKSLALNKLIRLYREENNPLVMMKTAENACLDIMQKWYKQNDILDFLSVNYGWSLVWHFAKPIFYRMWKMVNKSININSSNLVFSIYDVKNADEFSSIVDYPSISLNGWEIGSVYSERKWLIIFDDNTNSWETVKRIHDLAKDSWKYWKIDFFVCRSSSDVSKYTKNLSEDEILSIIKNSWVDNRRSKVNKEKSRYKEAIWAVVWNRVYKQRKYKSKRMKFS